MMTISEDRIVLKVKGRLPSWNALLSMNHWQRTKLKREIQENVRSALCQLEKGSSIPTIFRQSTALMPSDILGAYIAMHQTRRPSQRLKGSVKKAKKNI